jgi:hypothetical protein
MEEGRFAADTSLAAFARRLRVLGYDVLVVPGATLERLCAVAAADGRTVLTLSRRVPRACARTMRRVVVRGLEDDALRAIAAECPPGTRAFGRCTHCNALLGPPGSAAVIARAPVPPPAGVRVTGQCPDCRRCYWHGSHVDRLRVRLGALLGRELGPPTGS